MLETDARSLAARLQLTPLVVALAARDDPAPARAGSTADRRAAARAVVAPGDTLAAWRAGRRPPGVVATAAALPCPGRQGARVVSAPGRTVTTYARRHLGLAGRGPRRPLPELGQAVAVAPTCSTPASPSPCRSARSRSAARTSPRESLADVAARYRVPIAAVVAGANADALALRAGARVVFGLPVATRAGESLAGLAARLDPAGASLTPLGVATALRDQTGLLAPGAALLVTRTPSRRRPRDTSSATATPWRRSRPLSARPPTPSSLPTPASPGTRPRRGPCAPGTGITVPVGERITLPPDLTYRIRPGDTLAGVAERFGLSLPDLLRPETGNDTSTTLLAGQVTVVLPPFTHQVADAETPLEIAARYGLTVDALVAANPEGPFGHRARPGRRAVAAGGPAPALDRSGRRSTGRPAHSPDSSCTGCAAARPARPRPGRPGGGGLVHRRAPPDADRHRAAGHAALAAARRFRRDARPEREHPAPRRDDRRRRRQPGRPARRGRRLPASPSS